MSVIDTRRSEVVQRARSAVGIAAALAALAHAIPARAAEAPAPQRPVQRGFVIRSAQGDSLTVGGYIHVDARAFVGYGREANVNQILVRRARPVIDATLRNHFDFKLMPDFAGNKATLYDAYVDVRYLPYAQLRIGKFKPPVGLERLQSGNALQFVERAFPTSLVPNRDVGVMLFGDLNGLVWYGVGVFDGAADGAMNEGDLGGNKEGAARVFVTPFARTGLPYLKNLGLGASGTWGAPRGSPSSPEVPSFVSPGQSSIFKYASAALGTLPDPAKPDPDRTVVADGDHVRWDVQGYYYCGPFGVHSEYVRSSQRVRKGASAISPRNWAFEVTGSFVLTGEEAGYGALTPHHPFDPLAGQWGAVELVGRFHEIRIDEALFTDKVFADPTKQVRGANAWGAGVNWYLDRAFRLMVDYDRTHFFGGLSSGGKEADRSPEQVFLARAQAVF
jgi:phosphate-selective porin OprO/OprP